MDDYESMESFFKGFMVDQRTRDGAKDAVANNVANGQEKEVEESRKALYSGTLAGTNGLRNDAPAIDAGDEAVKGTTAM